MSVKATAALVLYNTVVQIPVYGRAILYRIFFIDVIEFSHKLHVKNPARGHKVEKTPSGRKKRTYSVYKEKTATVFGKSDTSK